MTAIFSLVSGAMHDIQSSISIYRIGFLHSMFMTERRDVFFQQYVEMG